MRLTQERCDYTVPGQPGDRCRRFRGHTQRKTEPWREWHLPDCGSAVNGRGNWINSGRWLSIFADVKANGGIAT